MLWTPKNQNPRPVNSMPIYMDVNLTVGGSNTFDVPPGKSHEVLRVHPAGQRSAARRRRAHARLRGRRCGSRTPETGKVITKVVASARCAGKVTKVSRRLFGVSGDGLKLEGQPQYRVVGEYDNPTRRDRSRARWPTWSASSSPDDMSKWPKIDPNDPDYQRDLASLQVAGGQVGAEHGGQDGKAGCRWITADGSWPDAAAGPTQESDRADAVRRHRSYERGSAECRAIACPSTTAPELPLRSAAPDPPLYHHRP